MFFRTFCSDSPNLFSPCQTLLGEILYDWRFLFLDSSTFYMCCPLLTVDRIWTEYIVCRLSKIKAQCGCETSLWLRDLFVAFGGPILRAYCGSYEDDNFSTSCTSSSSAAAAPTATLITGTFAFVGKRKPREPSKIWCIKFPFHALPIAVIVAMAAYHQLIVSPERI